MHAASPERDRPRLTLFGGPLLRRSTGVGIPLTPSHERLLTLVWGHEDHGIARGSAIWLLWEEEDNPRSRQRLRQLLHDLGLRLGFRPVAADGEDHLSPGSGLMASDLDEYSVALAEHQLQSALSLHRRGFASRLDGRAGGEEYEDWLLSKREGLRRRLREAAVRQWDQCRPLGAWKEAREAAEVLGALEPESESAVMKMVEARAMTGNLQAAEAAAADFLAAAISGTKLSRESRSLLERIRRMSPAPATSSATSPAPPPLVGRRQGLATARCMLARVGEGSFEFLLVKGEGGAGKTRLMEEIWKEANLGGFRCLDARPVELERRIPLNPLVDMLTDPEVAGHIRALSEPWRAVIASLLPTLPEGMAPPVVPPIAESSLSRRLYDAFATLFSEMARSEPLLLFLDDLQWADATTVAVLQFVQRRWRSGSLGIVATVRPDLVAAEDGVARYLTDTPDLPVTTVELGDLTETEARTLVDLVAGSELEPRVAGRLLALGGRNPFYLIELTRDFLAGKVQLPELPTDSITLPISLRQLLDPRIQSLGNEAASVGSYLAVWGRWITLRELARLTEKPAEDIAREVEELERCRLVTVERGRVRLAHELFRSALYQGLTATRRSVLHGKVAAFLDSADGQQPGETAIHFDRAGNAAGAALRGRQAADRALESGAMAEAAYFLQLVVDNVSDAGLKAEATADLAGVLHMNREITRANPLLELAASRLRMVGNESRALRMDIRRVEGLAELGAASLSDLLDRLATIKSLARISGDDEALALALDSELHLLHRSGKVAEIRALFDEIRVVAGSADPAAACLANAALALNVLFGDADEALRCAREAVRIAEEGDVQRHLLLTKNKLFFVLLYRGRTKSPEGILALAHARQLAQRSGDLLMRFQVESNCGVAHMDAYELDEANQCFATAGAILGRADAAVMRLNHHYNLGELAFLRGDLPEALNHFQVAESLLTPSAMPADILSLVTAAIGLCSMELGALADARHRETCLRNLPTSWHFDPTMMLTFAARLLERRGRHEEALALLTRHCERLREQFPIAWMKLLPLEVRLARRLGRSGWQDQLQVGIRQALGLGLVARAALLEEGFNAWPPTLRSSP